MTRSVEAVTKPTKAIVAGLLSALIAFGTSLTTALQGGSASFADLTDGQWLAAAVAALIAFGATGSVTYAVRNRPISV
ncbi:hypothetical protein [Rhodococcus koreensis]